MLDEQPIPTTKILVKVVAPPLPSRVDALKQELDPHQGAEPPWVQLVVQVKKPRQRLPDAAETAELDAEMPGPPLRRLPPVHVREPLSFPFAAPALRVPYPRVDPPEGRISELQAPPTKSEVVPH